MGGNMDKKESELIEKAREFENLLDSLDNRQIIFSKKQLEDYHARLESEMDENMVEFEDALIKETSQEIKKNVYNRLFSFLGR